MKKLALFIGLLLVIVTSVRAQDSNEHLKFMSIPIDGHIDDFIGKLKQQGWKDGYYSLQFDGTSSYISQSDVEENGILAKSVVGLMDGEEVSMSILYSERNGLVYGTKVHFNSKGYKTLAPIKPIYDSYVKRLEEQYGPPMIPPTFPKDLNAPCNPADTITTLFLADHGFISVSVTINKYGYGYLSLCGMDIANLKAVTYPSEDDLYVTQTVKEICGIPFGTSYQDAESMLKNKYGYPEYGTDPNVITYKHKKYAGITFDSIHFLFQSDGVNSYLNGCVFILDAKTEKEAKEKRELLHDILAKKYIMVDDTDENGFKYYFGGRSPISKDEVGFVINILKYDKDLARLYAPYAARLMYGTYSYVKEKF
ncbi:MAG: hypothetical protein IJ762_01110 [Bacteroidaceae bacterium]|nr:hypothetical protein [Bacteroidaceae bacterium]